MPANSQESPKVNTRIQVELAHADFIAGEIDTGFLARTELAGGEKK